MTNLPRVEGATGWSDDASSSDLNYLSSASLSSSFSSSAASSVLPAAPPSHSSQSDTISSDHHSTFSHPPSNGGCLAPVLISPVPRSSSLISNMGQNSSCAGTNAAAVPASTTSHLTAKGTALSNAAAATGSKLKRAFAARRKKVEDSSDSFRNDRGGERELNDISTDQLNSTPPITSTRTVAATKPLAQLATTVFARRTPKITSSHLPPTPPLKSAVIQMNNKLPAVLVSPNIRVDNRMTVVPVSPGIASAVTFIQNNDMKERGHWEGLERERDNSKDSWRKSDSTISHHTIRPGVAVGSRPSRPVSMAESLQSDHTVVAVNQRLSALVGDADFGMPEEDDFMKRQEDAVESSSLGREPSPPSSLRSKNRRSMSLNLGSNLHSEVRLLIPPASASSADSKHLTKSIQDVALMSPSLSSETTPSRPTANGILLPYNTGLHSPRNNIRGHLATLASTTNSRNALDHSLPPPTHHRPYHHQAQGTSFRQTAISMTSSLGPAAGLAKRAVEKMGRAWGGIGSSVSNSGHPTLPSVTALSSYSSGNTSDYGLARTGSTQSAGSTVAGLSSNIKSRRTPNAPSGSWSIASSAASSSLSDLDAFSAPAGPSLGKRLRGPARRQASGAGVAGGIVFGRDLQACVKETALNAAINSSNEDNLAVMSKSDLNVLEKRMLPAIVVRCAQHLIIWGVQEEGLFRVTGRPSHVAKLRTEFDIGSDYDMSNCSPGDLDPHAVASIFKAYLRELPEPILTHTLLPYFDAAMTAESNTVQLTPQQPSQGAQGHTLPSGPRSGLGLRKPPSLSTLAMPSFTGMRPPSQSLLNALRSLVAQLPRENRDLLRTATELIKVTAREHKTTKMPLSNLLLVFCPSLNMNPPLLRILCENRDIWNTESNVSRESIILDIKREIDADIDDGRADVVDEQSILAAKTIDQSQTKIDDFDRKSNSEYFGESVEPRVSRSRIRGVRRAPVSTMYMDATDTTSIADISILHPSNSHSRTSSVDTSPHSSFKDDASYLSTSEGQSTRSSRFKPPNLDTPIPPPLSSSAESLATPSFSSEEASFTNLSVKDDLCTKTHSPSPLMIAESIRLPLSTKPRRPVIWGPISSPIRFPTPGSIPSTPLSTAQPKPVLSVPITSIPFDSVDLSPSPLRRLKKPSLHLLFTKKSASSLTSPSTYLQPRSASDSNMSTPISAVTAPQGSTYTLPLVSFQSSPIRASLGQDINNESASSIQNDTSPHITSVDADPVSSSATTTRTGETPIADLFRSRLNTMLDDDPPHLPSTEFEGSRISATSSNPLGDDDFCEAQDWTQSVLMAADADVWKMLDGADTRRQ